MKKLMSPNGRVHINDPEEPTDWSLCDHAESGFWLDTDAPVTCYQCMRMSTKSIKSTKVISRMVQLVSAFGDCDVIGENGQPVHGIVQDIREGKTVFVIICGN